MEIPILHDKIDQTRKYMSGIREEYDRFKAEASVKLGMGHDRLHNDYGASADRYPPTNA